MAKPIYLDYAATTPVAPEIAALMAQYLTMDGIFANPASRAHLFGWQAEEAVETARGQVAELIGADPREIVFTSGATESNNLALIGLAAARKHRGRHIVTSAVEHKAVLDTCAYLERSGYELTYLKPCADGRVSVAAVQEALRDDTVLVSVMHVNNELGAINSLAQIGRLCRDRDIAFHSDAAQSAGRLPIDVNGMNIDLLSLSAHKMYGPKGAGALYVRRAEQIKIEALIHGGGHERGMRSGTLATHQIVGLGAAAVAAKANMAADHDYLNKLAGLFLQGLEGLKVKVNGPAPQNYEPLLSSNTRVPGILNVCFEGCDGEQLLSALPGVAVSSGSACTSASVEPSYVLRAIGLSDAEAHASLRFSFGRYTRVADIEQATVQLRSALIALNGQVRAYPG